MSIVKRLKRPKPLAAFAAVALASALCAGAAQAHDSDVRWSVTIGSPLATYPDPVVRVPVYRAPAPAYRYPAPVHAPVRYQAPTHWDRDGDGIANRYDRLYNPVWDRDGDGIPNRRDPRYDPWWDRDGDGVPNRYDRHDGRRRGDPYRDGWRHDDPRRGADRPLLPDR